MRFFDLDACFFAVGAVADLVLAAGGFRSVVDLREVRPEEVFFLTLFTDLGADFTALTLSFTAFAADFTVFTLDFTALVFSLDLAFFLVF